MGEESSEPTAHEFHSINEKTKALVGAIKLVGLGGIMSPVLLIVTMFPRQPSIEAQKIVMRD